MLDIEKELDKLVIPIKTNFNIEVFDINNRQQAMALSALITRKLEEPKYADRIQKILYEIKEDIILNTKPLIT